MASSKRRAAGFSLVEVLVSIVVLSLGLLGAVGMLMTSVRSMNESGSFTAAVNLARELSEKVRINRGVAAAGSSPYLIDVKSTDPLPAQQRACVGPGAVCSASDIAAWDLHEWTARVRARLPEADVVVCFDSDPADAEEYRWDCAGEGRNLVVKLGWVPRMGSEQEMGADRAPRVVMQLVPGHDHDGAGAI